MDSIYFLQLKLFLRFFLNLNVVAQLVVPAGWGSCLQGLAFFPATFHNCLCSESLLIIILFLYLIVCNAISSGCGVLASVMLFLGESNSSLDLCLFVALMGLFEKRRFRNFLVAVQDYQTDKKTLDPDMKTCDLFQKFGLDANTQEFTGHALALHHNEE